MDNNELGNFTNLEIGKYIVAVSFRVDYYNLNPLKQLLTYAKFKEGRFDCRTLTGEERYRIDLESVSDSLGNSVEDMVNAKCYIFYYPEDNGYFSQVIISDYFIYVYVRSVNWGDTYESLLYKVIDLLTEECLTEGFSLRSIRASHIYHFVLRNDFLKKIYPKSFFGLRYFKELNNSSQQFEARFEFDQEKECVGRLISTMEPVVNENGEELNNVVIQTYAMQSIISLDRDYLNREFGGTFGLTTTIIEKCAEII